MNSEKYRNSDECLKISTKVPSIVSLYTVFRFDFLKDMNCSERITLFHNNTMHIIQLILKIIFYFENFCLAKMSSEVHLKLLRFVYLDFIFFENRIKFICKFMFPKFKKKKILIFVNKLLVFSYLSKELV